MQIFTEAKHQVLANLVNFSYDPVNYEHLHLLGVLDIFLEQLSEEDPKLVNFALGGLCNLALGKFKLCPYFKIKICI